jgi:hypothetical protein
VPMFAHLTLYHRQRIQFVTSPEGSTAFTGLFVA